MTEFPRAAPSPARPRSSRRERRPVVSHLRRRGSPPLTSLRSPLPSIPLSWSRGARGEDLRSKLLPSRAPDPLFVSPRDFDSFLGLAILLLPSHPMPHRLFPSCCSQDTPPPLHLSSNTTFSFVHLSSTASFVSFLHTPLSSPPLLFFLLPCHILPLVFLSSFPLPFVSRFLPAFPRRPCPLSLLPILYSSSK